MRTFHVGGLKTTFTAAIKAHGYTSLKKCTLSQLKELRDIFRAEGKTTYLKKVIKEINDRL